MELTDNRGVQEIRKCLLIAFLPRNPVEEILANFSKLIIDWFLAHIF